ncbi:MAG: hypothetical protein HDT38_07490 [Clostridiales bacterium]|nr:hypothetical protein [Clostridiales bacterium]
MSDFKLKIAIGSAQIELEGDGELVHTIFQELKDTGLGNIAPLVQAEAKTLYYDDGKDDGGTLSDGTAEKLQNDSGSFSKEHPSLENVVLQGRPQKESEWILIYAAYASNWGETLFTREDLRSKYSETKRTTETRSKNFAANLKSLSSSNYISAVNDKEFRMESAGLEKAENILLGSSGTKKANKRNGVSIKRTPSTYEFLELGLSEEERVKYKHFWDCHDHSSNINKAVLAAYWLKANKSIVDFTPNHLFTMLRTVEERTSFDLVSAIKNAKKDKNYFVLGSDKGSYKITHIGEDHVKQLETDQKEDE